MLAAQHWNSHRELGEGEVAELLLEPVAQRLRGVQVGARAHGAGDLAPGAVAVDLVALAHRAPQVEQPVDDRRGRVAGDHQPVQRAHRGAQDEVGPDAALEQRAEHADLDGPEQPATAEDEGGALELIAQRGRRAGRVTARGGSRCDPLRWPVLDPEDQDRDQAGTAASAAVNPQAPPAAPRQQQEERDADVGDVEPAVHDADHRGRFAPSSLGGGAVESRGGTSGGRPTKTSDG